MWRQIQPNFDKVFFGISHDGAQFDGFRWDGTASWEEYRFRLDNYVGDDSVWVGWQFTSNGSVQYEGAWVDDIVMLKYTPGQLTARGTLYYYDRDNTFAGSSTTWAYLYDQDPGGTDDLLAATTTDADGFFQFPSIPNWDDDDPDPDPNHRRLDTYIVFETE